MEVPWPRGPFILAVGSAQQVRQAPGMRGPPPAAHLGPVTGDDWQLLPPPSRGRWQLPLDWE